MPADAFDSIIKSLGSQGTQEANGLPGWIRPGASVLYESQTAGKTLPAIVDNISSSKQMVLLKFPHAKGGKMVPFAQILGKSNPLRQGKPSAAAPGAAKDADDSDASEDPEEFLAGIDKKWRSDTSAKQSAAPVQGPQLMPDWARRMEREKVEDLTSAKIHDIDSSPEKEVSKNKSKKDAPEDLENPYALGAEVTAAVAAEAKEAKKRAKRTRAASASRSLSAGSAAGRGSSPNGKAKQGEKATQRKASEPSPRRESRSPSRKPAKKRRKPSRSPSPEPPPKKRRSSSRKAPPKKRRSPSQRRRKASRSRSAEKRRSPSQRRRKASRSRSAEPLPKKRRQASHSPVPEPPKQKRRKASRSTSPRKKDSHSPRRKSSRSPRRRR